MTDENLHYIGIWTFGLRYSNIQVNFNVQIIVIYSNDKYKVARKFTDFQEDENETFREVAHGSNDGSPLNSEGVDTDEDEN